jgi:SAM-dependent methyltransferase
VKLNILKLPLKVSARARSFMRRTWIRYAGHGKSRAEVLRGVEQLYATPDPWKMASQKEQFRFVRTSEILAREFIRPAQRVGSILEIGCGEGHQSEHLSRLCDQLTGIDIAAQAIERARIRVPAVEWVLGNLEDQPWVGGRKFDIVTACEVLYGFGNIPQTLQLMSRLGDACLVTYFDGAAHAVKWPLRAIRLEGRESFVFEDVTWTAVWWRSKPGRRHA